MTTTLADLATLLQTLFTTDATDFAHATGFVRRQRLLTGPVFAQTVVFGWLHDPTAALADLAALAADLGAAVSPSALDQRFTPAAAAFLAALLAGAMNYAGAGAAGTGTLLDRFTGVYIDDTTTIGLPLALAEFFPGCGGRGGRGGPTAALKVPLRLELRTGALTVSDLQPGRRCDVAGSLAHAPLPAGSLRLADLGYYSLQALQAYDEQGVYVLSRLPARTAVFAAQGRRWQLQAFLQAQPGGPVDTWVEVGSRWRLRLRLVAWRLPAAVAATRRQRLAQRAQQCGRPVSAAQAELSGWMVLVTTLTADQLSLLEACVLARVRWQVEWVFRLWMSGGGLDQSAGHKPYRVLCELLAKLLGLVVQHWLLLLAGPPRRQSQVRSAKRVRSAAAAVAQALRDVVALEGELMTLQRRLHRVAGKQRRRGKPAAFQLIDNPYNTESDYLPTS